MKHCSMVLALMFAGVAFSGDNAKDIKAVEGKWVMKSAEIAGVKLPDEQVKTISLVLEGEKYTVNVGDKVDKGTVKIDATTKPKTIDIKGTDGPNKGKTMLAIYELKDDTLRVCYDLTGKERPKDFVSSKEQPFFLATYMRSK